MTHQAKVKHEFSQSLDLQGRIALVMAAHSAHGHVSRKRLMSMYGITQIQAGSLMRDFIHAYANDLEWNAHHSHYEYAAKKR
jgi:hypothetical protein